jgi:hypothetical protein
MCQPKWRPHCDMVCCYTNSETQIHLKYWGYYLTVGFTVFDDLTVVLPPGKLCRSCFLSVLDCIKYSYSKVGSHGESMLMWILFLSNSASRQRLYCRHFTVLYSVYVQGEVTALWLSIMLKLCARGNWYVWAVRLWAMENHTEKQIFKQLITSYRAEWAGCLCLEWWETS